MGARRGIRNFRGSFVGYVKVTLVVLDAPNLLPDDSGMSADNLFDILYPLDSAVLDFDVYWSQPFFSDKSDAGQSGLRKADPCLPKVDNASVHSKEINASDNLRRQLFRDHVRDEQHHLFYLDWQQGLIFSLCSLPQMPLGYSTPIRAVPIPLDICNERTLK